MNKITSIWLMVFIVTMIILQFDCKDSGVEPILPSDTTWTYLGLKGENINSMAIDPTNPDVIYISGMRKLLKTTNGGNTWDSLYQTGFFSMAIDPRNPEIIYGGLAGIGKSTDGGHTWTFSEGIISDGSATVGALEIDPVNSNILYAGAGGIWGGYFYKSVDAGLNWMLIDRNVVGGSGSIKSVAIDPTNSNIIYIGTDGIYKSADAGENWTFAEDGPSSFVYSLVINKSNPQKIISGCSRVDGSILKSENGGES